MLSIDKRKKYHYFSYVSFPGKLGKEANQLNEIGEIPNRTTRRKIQFRENWIGIFTLYFCKCTHHE